MAKKLPEIRETGLGDITEIMHNQGPVSDYSWMAIDPQEYRDAEALPRQNVDAIPELTAALTFEKGDDVPHAIPLRPHTTVNTNPLESKGPSIRPSALTAVRDKVASYIMVGMPARHIQAKLQAEFGPKEICMAGQDIRNIVGERGLLGNVYIDAKHFPRCAQRGPHKEFVARHASSALFVLAKDACGGCVHQKGGRCSIFQKRIVSSVPYTTKTLAYYASRLASEKRLNLSTMPTSDEEIKGVLRAAFTRTPIRKRETSVRTIQNHPKTVKPGITESDIAAYKERQAQKVKPDAMPSPLYLMAAKRLMLSKVDIHSLSASSDPQIRSLTREYGILGHTYLDIDALGGCNAALHLIKTRKLSPSYALLRSSADPEAHAKLSKIVKIVARHPELGKGDFILACERAHREDRITGEQLRSAVTNVPENTDWRHLIAQVNLYEPKVEAKGADVSPAPRAMLHHGNPGKETAVAEVSPVEVNKFIAHQMNLGLAGQPLQKAILSRYTYAELRQVPEIGAKLGANEGVQGSYFIDPSIYRDYGKGCIEGSKHFRKQGAKYLLASNGCTGCVYQTAPSWCSKYCKQLIRHIPDSIRQAAKQRRQLAVQPQTAPIENPVEEYGLSAELPIDLNGSRSREINISVPSHSIDDE